eukprot:m.20812 g.20812  ORF g.20812 m.20812 type:complete len:229 (+) comp12255_c0_seq2:95-781(+)
MCVRFASGGGATRIADVSAMDVACVRTPSTGNGVDPGSIDRVYLKSAMIVGPVREEEEEDEAEDDVIMVDDDVIATKDDVAAPPMAAPPVTRAQADPVPSAMETAVASTETSTIVPSDALPVASCPRPRSVRATAKHSSATAGLPASQPVTSSPLVTSSSARRTPVSAVPRTRAKGRPLAESTDCSGSSGGSDPSLSLKKPRMAKAARTTPPQRRMTRYHSKSRKSDV